MGLILGILTLPLAPVRGAVWLADQILEEAERQWYDPAAVQAALLDVQERREAGELSDDEADRLEEELVERLLS